MAKEKKNKNNDWDDGRTVAPMNGDELPQYRRILFSGRKSKGEAKKDENAVQLTKKERRAMTRALFAELLPRLIVVLCGFGIVAGLMYLWLS